MKDVTNKAKLDMKKLGLVTAYFFCKSEVILKLKFYLKETTTIKEKYREAVYLIISLTEFIK